MSQQSNSILKQLADCKKELYQSKLRIEELEEFIILDSHNQDAILELEHNQNENLMKEIEKLRDELKRANDIIEKQKDEITLLKFNVEILREDIFDENTQVHEKEDEDED